SLKLVFHLVLAFKSGQSTYCPVSIHVVYLSFTAGLVVVSRSLAMPSRNFCRTSYGASQLAPRPATRKYPARRDPSSWRDCESNAVTAINAADIITIPRSTPNAPPNKRSAQRNP